MRFSDERYHHSTLAPSSRPSAHPRFSSSECATRSDPRSILHRRSRRSITYKRSSSSNNNAPHRRLQASHRGPWLPVARRTSMQAATTTINSSDLARPSTTITPASRASRERDHQRPPTSHRHLLHRTRLRTTRRSHPLRRLLSRGLATTSLRAPTSPRTRRPTCTRTRRLRSVELECATTARIAGIVVMSDAMSSS